MEDKILPMIISSKSTIEEEGKIQHPLGQDKDATDWTLASTKSISQFVCPHYISFKEPRLVRDPLKKLEFNKKLLALAIMCLISSYLWESSIHTLPKTLQRNRGIHIDLQNFVWKLGGQDVDNDGQVKERMKRAHDYFVQVKIFTSKKVHDQAIRLKKFEHDLKRLLFNLEDQD